LPQSLVASLAIQSVAEWGYNRLLRLTRQITRQEPPPSGKTDLRFLGDPDLVAPIMWRTAL